jgi:hypothetical protein
MQRAEVSARREMMAIFSDIRIGDEFHIRAIKSDTR